MGWFSNSASSPSAPKVSADGTPEAPDRSARAQCWEARDSYFRCLDRNNIVDPLGEADRANSVCGKEDVTFGKNCASSWVQYFKKRRVMEFKKEETLRRLQSEGAKPLPDGQAGR